ncbi:MAG: tail fiber domain-containing protein [Patescibacteria group bacterium]|nr:tail fiber domain-containing protein [Patescibacteria group bacterium]
MTDGSGNLSWQSVSGVGGVTGTGTSNSIARFTGTSTIGDSGLTDDGSVIGITRDVSFSASTPRITITDGETLTIHDGTNNLLTLADNGGTATLSVNALTIGGDTISEFVGTGLQIGSGTLSTTLGTSVDLTSEVTGILPVANGGTGVNGGSAANGQLLIGNGTGYTLATLTAGTGIGVTNASGAITIANTGVTSITGTSNQVSASGSTGAITLSLPQSIATTSNVQFGSLALGTTGSLAGTTTINASAAATGEVRFNELSGNGSNYIAFRAPNDLGASNYTLTLPVNDGDSNQVLLTDGSGNLSWTSVSGIEAGDISAVGSMTSGLAFGDATADDDWLGLGASAGRIEFDDQTTDEVNILGARLGLGTSDPNHLFDAVSSATSGSNRTVSSAITAGNGSTSGDYTAIRGTAQTNGGTISGTTLIGLEGYVGSNNATGTSLTGIAVRGTLPTGASNETGSSFTSLSAFYAGAPALDLGTATSVYGLYLEGMETTGVTNGYGIYQIGVNDTNYFAGNIGIGTSGPGARLESLATTEQLRLSYDGSNSTSFTVSSGGDLTIAPTGGDTNLTGTLDVSGKGVFGGTASLDQTVIGFSSRQLLNVRGTETSVAESLQMGTYSELTFNPSASASGVSAFGGAFSVFSTSGNTQPIGSLIGLYTEGQHAGNAALTSLVGSQIRSNNFGSGANADVTTLTVGDFYGSNSSAGDVTTANGILAQLALTSTGNISTARGLFINSTLDTGGGAITNNYGGWISTQTVGTNDYGLRIDAADTQTLWLSGNADNTTAAAGIAFGASRDTNLYRGAANTLQTDDSFTVNGGNLLITAQGDLRLAETSGGNYFGLQAASSMDSNDVYTWPSDYPPGSGYALTSDATGALSWSVSGGDITAIGDVSSGEAFTSSGTAGANLWFYDPDGRGQLTLANLTAPRTYTLPNISGTVAIQNDSSLTGGSILFANSSGQITQANSTLFYDTSTSRVGIGDTNPAALFTVGNGDLFQVNSSGFALLPNGNNGTPSLSFTDDQNTGIYSSTDEQIDFATNGNQRANVTNDGFTITGQGDLRLNDSDNSNYSGFQANSTTTTSYLLTLPAALPGTPGTYTLSTDETGAMSFTSGASGDITAVGSMLTGAAFADSGADDDWLGLGASAGRIEFDDQTTDEVNILGANVGIGTSAPSSLLHLVGTSQQLRIGFDVSNYITGTVGATGALTFDAVGSGAAFNFSDSVYVTNGNLFLGTSGSVNSLITMYSAGAGEAAPTIQTNSNGDLTINASTGVVNIGSGYGGITLDPGHNNLLANLTGAGNFLVQDNGATFVTFDSTSTTTTFDYTQNYGDALKINANSLQSGYGLNISSTSTGLNSGRLFTTDYTMSSGSQAFNGRIANIGMTKTLTTGSGQTETGSVFNLSRAFTLNTGAAATLQTNVFNLTDTITQTSGTLTNTAATALITRTCGSSVTCSGALLSLVGDGAGTDTTGISITKTSGTMTTGLVIGSGSQTITAGINLDSTGITTDIILQNDETIDNNIDGQIKIGDTAQLVLGNQASDPGTSANGAMYYNTTSHTFRCRVNGAWQQCGGGTTTVGSMTGATLFADSTADDDWLGLGASAGRIEFDDQTLDEVNVLGAKLTVGTSTPSTVGQAFEVYGNSSLSSSQALSYLNYDFAGTAGGDLLRLNIGASTNIGNFINIMDDGTSVFSISETGLSTSLPTSFTSPGDVSMSYDLLMTNQTASYIRSNAPLYIEAGESFENNDLTLKTYGTGQVIFDTPSGVEVYANIANGYAGYFFNDGNNTNRYGLLVQAGLDTSPGAGIDGTLIQFYDGDGTDVGEITFDGTTTTYGTTSDARVKANIVPSKRGLADVLNIKVRDYEFTNDPNGGTVTGFIAQELYEIYPQAVQAYFDQPDKLWGVDYGKLTPLLVKSIQEQQAMIDSINAMTTTQTAQISEVDVENDALQVFKTAAEIKMSRIEQDVATISAALASLSAQSKQITNVASIEAGLAALDARTTTLESKTAALETQVASLSAKLADAVLGVNTATDSALTVSAPLARSSAVLDDLAVTGLTKLGDLSVTGTISAGLLTIEGFDDLGESSINTLGGTLKLQALGTAGVELVGGKVSIDTDGSVVVQRSIEVKKVKINTTDITSASLGTASIEAGTKKITIPTTAVTADSAIFVTAQNSISAPLFVSQQVPGVSFTVSINTIQTNDVQFKWWIVDNVQDESSSSAF